MLVYNDSTRIQNKILKHRHSANIHEDQMYLYGGLVNNTESEDLSIINLSKTFFVKRKLDLEFRNFESYSKACHNWFQSWSKDSV